eukprot:TRINITY_DN12307_c0_g3_i1.p1 TRINITY_DN12307_c0_g3~~TRINITY_DN12307_c0_g3_i1.p1  ORF type:complete len:1042 (+),score=296.64 TRINITY_DN12307_c0_g3_i1:111-3236(+)
MSDSLAPEWMKVSGHSGRRSSTSGASAKANTFRLSQEQLLSRLPKKVTKPVRLRDFPGLEAASYQPPLALQPPTQQELQDLRDNGVNSNVFRQNFGRGRGRGRPTNDRDRNPIGPHRSPVQTEGRGFKGNQQRSRNNSNTDFNWRVRTAPSSDAVRNHRSHNHHNTDLPEWDDPVEEGTFDEHGNFVASSAGGDVFDALEEPQQPGHWRQQLATRGGSTSSAPPPGLAAPSEAVEDVQWVYKDTAGALQGPFTGAQMQEWFTGGFLPDTLELRRNDDTQFILLADLKASSLQHATLPFLRPFPTKLLATSQQAYNEPPPDSMLARLQRSSQSQDDTIKPAPAAAQPTTTAAQPDYPLAQPAPTSAAAQPASSQSTPAPTPTSTSTPALATTAASASTTTSVSTIATSLTSQQPQAQPQPQTNADLQQSQTNMLNKLMAASKSHREGQGHDQGEPSLTQLLQQHKDTSDRMHTIRTHGSEMHAQMQALAAQHKQATQQLSNGSISELARQQLTQQLARINSDANVIRTKYTQLQQEDALARSQLQTLTERIRQEQDKQQREQQELQRQQQQEQQRRQEEEAKRQAHLEEEQRAKAKAEAERRQAEAQAKAEAEAAAAKAAAAAKKTKAKKATKAASPSKPEKKPSGPSLADIEREAKEQSDARKRAEQAQAEARALAQSHVAEGSQWIKPMQQAAPVVKSSGKTMSLREIEEQEQKEASRREAQRQIQIEQARQQQVAHLNAMAQQQKAMSKQGSWAKGSAPVAAASPSKPKPKSLTEIEAEEARARAQAPKTGRPQPSLGPASTRAAPLWAGKPKSSSTSSGPAWGGAAPTPVALPSTKAQPTRVIKSAAATPTNDDSFWMSTAKSSKSSKGNTKANPKPRSSSSSSASHAAGSRSAAAPTAATLRIGSGNAPLDPKFLNWCREQLAGIPNTVDIDTYINFLMDFGSKSDVFDYVSETMDDVDRARKFAHAFVEKRIHAYASPEGNVVVSKPQVVDDTWESANKRKGKKKKKEFQKLDPRLLGYQVSSGQGPSRGEIDFGL